MDTDRFWNKINFEVVPLDQNSHFLSFLIFLHGKQIFSYIVINNNCDKKCLQNNNLKRSQLENVQKGPILLW
jgi:hypothetical protein